jgi:hypothetical protein
MQAISSLDDTARANLLQILKSKNIQSLASASSKSYTVPSMQSSAVVSEKPKAQPTADPTRNELRIRVLSTHGDPHLCGVTEIELFDEVGKKVVISHSNVLILGSSAKTI